MKPCIHCGQIKPLTEFHAHPRMADGHLNKCKRCVCAYVAEREKQLRAFSPTWTLAERARCREKQARYRAQGVATPPAESTKLEWAARNPEKRRAHAVVARAVRAGRLIRQPCAVCGCAKSEAHHEDYAQPLAVLWLCDTHHKETHVKQREAQLLTR